MQNGTRRYSEKLLPRSCVSCRVNSVVQPDPHSGELHPFPTFCSTPCDSSEFSLLSPRKVLDFRSPFCLNRIPILDNYNRSPTAIFSRPSISSLFSMLQYHFFGNKRSNSCLCPHLMPSQFITMRTPNPTARGTPQYEPANVRSTPTTASHGEARTRKTRRVNPPRINATYSTGIRNSSPIMASNKLVGPFMLRFCTPTPTGFRRHCK